MVNLFHLFIDVLHLDLSEVQSCNNAMRNFHRYEIGTRNTAFCQGDKCMYRYRYNVYRYKITLDNLECPDGCCTF